MANHMRFRKADAKRLRYFAVNSATVIEIGDLLYQEVDDIRPASDATYGASLAITQANFAKQFKGVAMSASQSGETEPVLVATRATSRSTAHRQPSKSATWSARTITPAGPP